MLANISQFESLQGWANQKLGYSILGAFSPILIYNEITDELEKYYTESLKSNSTVHLANIYQLLKKLNSSSNNINELIKTRDENANNKKVVNRINSYLKGEIKKLNSEIKATAKDCRDKWLNTPYDDDTPEEGRQEYPFKKSDIRTLLRLYDNCPNIDYVLDRDDFITIMEEINQQVAIDNINDAQRTISAIKREYKAGKLSESDYKRYMREEEKEIREKEEYLNKFGREYGHRVKRSERKLDRDRDGNLYQVLYDPNTRKSPEKDDRNRYISREWYDESGNSGREYLLGNRVDYNKNGEMVLVQHWVREHQLLPELNFDSNHPALKKLISVRDSIIKDPSSITITNPDAFDTKKLREYFTEARRLINNPDIITSALKRKALISDMNSIRRAHETFLKKVEEFVSKIQSDGEKHKKMFQSEINPFKRYTE